MLARYDPLLVLLSVLIAVVASFVALDMASRVAATRSRQSAVYWLGGGAVAMGTGIWAMHFIGMLAFSLPIPLAYSLPVTLSSLLLAMLSSAVALSTVSRPRLSARRLALAGTLMGTGITAMHYLGMEAMQMQPRIEYDPPLFVASALIAIAASAAAMWISFQLRHETILSGLYKKFTGSLVMGAAIAGMHYTGMAAARFAKGSVCGASTLGQGSGWLAAAVGGLSSLFLMTTLLISVYAAMQPTIRSRLVFLVITCVVPVSLVAAALVFYDYQRGRDQQALDLISTARAVMATVDKDLDSVEAGLLVLSTSRVLAADNYAEFYKQATDSLPYLRANAIALSDATGAQLIDTRRPYGESLPWFENSAQAKRVFDSGKPAISDFFVGALNRDPLITIGVPVRRGGSIAFQISATVLSSRLSDLLMHQRLPPDWIVAIYDRTGTIVARSHEMSRFVGAKGAAGVLKRLAQVDEGALDATTLEGIPVLSAFSRSPSSQWAVAIGIPRSNFTNRLLTTLGWLLLGLLSLLSISVALAWRISGTIAAAVHDLIAPALALGSGAPVQVAPLGLTEADEVSQALSKAAHILASAQHSAHHDALTGLANRSLFNQMVLQQMAVARRSGSSLAVLYIDLDGFKAVNDAHGHEVGDALLQAAAERMKMNIRACDLAARLGGDEFAVALVQAGQEGAAVVAAKLVDSLSHAFSIGNLNLQISASVGVAVHAQGECSYEDLLRSADVAMYRAKQAGKNRFVMNCP